MRVAVAQFRNAYQSRVPNAAGWWWLGDDVVKVELHNGELLMRVKGRLKLLDDKQPWRGPAIVDARTPKVVNDEDIPF